MTEVEFREMKRRLADLEEWKRDQLARIESRIRFDNAMGKACSRMSRLLLESEAVLRKAAESAPPHIAAGLLGMAGRIADNRRESNADIGAAAKPAAL